jgi:hypothetical protein
VHYELDLEPDLRRAWQHFQPWLWLFASQYAAKQISSWLLALMINHQLSVCFGQHLLAAGLCTTSWTLSQTSLARRGRGSIRALEAWWCLSTSWWVVDE